MIPLDDRQEPRFLDEIDLVEEEEHRRLDVLHQVEDEAVALPGGSVDIHDQPEHVHFPHRVDGGIHHPDVHAMERTMDARSVEEDDLGVGIVAHAENPRPRGLRLVGHDGQLGPDQPVEQCGLPCVRPADERDEARFQPVRSCASTGCSRVSRTL